MLSDRGSVGECRSYPVTGRCSTQRNRRNSLPASTLAPPAPPSLMALTLTRITGLVSASAASFCSKDRRYHGIPPSTCAMAALQYGGWEAYGKLHAQKLGCFT